MRPQAISACGCLALTKQPPWKNSYGYSRDFYGCILKCLAKYTPKLIGHGMFGTELNVKIVAEGKLIGLSGLSINFIPYVT